MMGGCMVSLTCPSCETETRMDLDAIYAEHHPDWPALNRLIYTCPRCRQPQRHNLTGPQWEVLNRLAGDLLRCITMPTGILTRFAAGPPVLTGDDLIDFCRELYADEAAT